MFTRAAAPHFRPVVFATFVLLAGLAGVRQAAAQQPAAPAAEAPPWKVEFVVGGVASTGNTDSATLDLDLTSTRTKGLNTLTISQDVTVTRTAEKHKHAGKNKTTEPATVDTFAADVKHHHQVSKTSRLFQVTHAGWTRDTDAGILNRLIAGAGIGATLHESKASSLKADLLGAGLWREEVDDDVKGVYVTASLNYHRTLSPTGKLTSSFQLVQNISKGNDYRLETKHSLHAAFSKRYGLKISGQAIYDNQPAALILLDDTDSTKTLKGLARGLNTKVKAGFTISF